MKNIFDEQADEIVIEELFFDPGDEQPEDLQDEIFE